MDHKERLAHVIHHEKTDCVPVAFWRHFPVDDQNAESLAASTISFQQEFNFDFVKVSPSSSYCIKDWGATDLWQGNPEGTREYQQPVIEAPRDWGKLPVLNPKKGNLADQIRCLEIVKKQLPAHTPIIQTIFSPLTQAKNLTGKNHIINHLRSYPDDLIKGLETITKSTISFIEECAKVGIDGIFFAEQFASFDLLSESEFISFGKKFDQRIFLALEPFWFNLLHIHGQNIMFDQVADFPFQVFNWHDRETSPNLRVGKSITHRAVCGGISRITSMVLGDPQAITKEIDESLAQTRSKGFILGTGCVLPLTTPIGNIQAAVNYIRSQ